MVGLPLSVLQPAPAHAMPIPFELFSEAQPRALSVRIPAESNREVLRWVRYFTGRDRQRFARFMARGAFYKTLIQDILLENGVPSEMYYLAMIESGFARGARSSAKAVGVWQFMPATAKLYGLRVDREIDERLDIIRSSRAAAHMLKDLHREFGSWYLAMAAYNCGVGRVRSAIRKTRTHDFWRLAYRDALPDETANYIPKFQAAMSIARNPEKYGFQRLTNYDFPLLQRVRMPGRMGIGEIARRRGLSVKTIASLNPHLLNARTPIAPYDVWVPR